MSDYETALAPAQSMLVYPASSFVVTNGANLDDPMSFAAELMLDDVYGLVPQARTQRLNLHPTDDAYFTVAKDTDAGTPGFAVHLDCVVTLMSPDGQTNDAIVLVEVDGPGDIEGIYVLPLVPLMARTAYALVGVDTNSARQKLAQVACVSFTRGTHITLSSGAQKPIQDVVAGDMVLTRDDGPQPVRWVGHSTTRAVGEFAPIKIAAGTLNNDHDLIVSPDHRLFVYQRSDELGAGRSELLVKARHLVNGQTVTVQEGGFVDYFQLLFDNHQIIYAEGIAAESMLIDTRTKPALPSELADQITDVIRSHSSLPHAGLDVSENLLNRPDAADVLRKASIG